MAIIILPICFIAILLNLGLYAGKQAKKRNIFLGSILAFCTVLLVITESLSAARSLNFSWIFSSWSVFTLAALFNLFVNQGRTISMLDKHRQKIIFTYQRLTLVQKLMMLFVGVLLLMLFLQGVIYPPNNWDSMTYHLARITSWVSHSSVEVFRSHITRQLYQPPLSEYVIMHFNVLNGGDYFSNSVQFFFYLFSLVAVAAITQKLNLRRKYQLLAVLICATIPELTLQASSTQNDVVVAFFTFTTCHFAYKAVMLPRLKYYAITGIAAGLALLTKGTAYIYLAPILLLIAVFILIKLYKTRHLTYVWYGLFTLLLLLSINAASYYRNSKFSGNMLGVDKAESQFYANQQMSPVLLLSNLVKNGAMHTGIKYTGYLAAAADSVLHKVHRAAGIDIDNPLVNYRDMKYTTHTLATQEDSAPNLYHFLLILGSMVVLVICIYKKRISLVAAMLLLVLIIQVLFFCGYLKWQPWHSRLHLPMFMLGVPLIAYAMSINKIFRKATYILLPFTLLYAVTVVSNNELRPFSFNKLKQPRFQNYFTAKPDSYAEYQQINNEVQKAGYKNIGLILGIDDWQYPLFVDCYRRQLNPVHISVDNFSRSIPVSPVIVDCIISTNINTKHITFKGRTFYNQQPNNKRIFLYK